jgi:hypothetical protein
VEDKRSDARQGKLHGGRLGAEERHADEGATREGRDGARPAARGSCGGAARLGGASLARGGRLGANRAVAVVLGVRKGMRRIEKKTKQKIGLSLFSNQILGGLNSTKK